jgi:hypothetical protein
LLCRYAAVELVTYNGQNRYLCNLVVTFDFSEAGLCSG